MELMQSHPEQPRQPASLQRPRSARPWTGPALHAAMVVGAALLALLPAVAPPAAAAQAPRSGSERVEEAFDSADVLGRARGAQAAFERRRARLLPVTLGGWGAECDEIVGRFCEWYDEGEWTPGPEPAEIGLLRNDLVAYLDSVAVLVPGDDWVLGQRVWYRTEAGDADGAARVAAACGGAEAWWCAALEGLALHAAGRHARAAQAFERALQAMPGEQAWTWRLPRRAVDGDARAVLDDLDAAAGDSAAAVLDRLWTLADPLYLVEGNDRKTAHYARWTVSTLRERARNPFGISWGRDLEELTVRLGWEMWWERRTSRDLAAAPDVIGHRHPQNREYMPPGSVLIDPSSATPDDLRPGKRRPRSLHAPSYAPILLPMEGQVAVFPRGRSVAVVATTWLPPDTTVHADHTHPVPWLEPGDQAGRPGRAGLFLVSPDGRVVHGSSVDTVDAALVVEAPAGRWIVSAESWSPPRRRAGRLRRGLAADTLPPDLPTLSDLLFVRPGGGDPSSLEDAAARAIPAPRVRSTDAVGVVWEVAGMGFDPAVLGYELSVRKRDGNIFRRAGRWLGLVGDPEGLSLTWEEPGPDSPTTLLRQIDVDLPDGGAGEYDVLLRVHLAGRAPLESRARLVVAERG